MTTLDDFDFDRVIGHGANGTVWRARQRGPVPRTVAVKRIRVGGDERLRDRIRREAEILSVLDHPNIVRVLDVIEHRGEIAIAMPVADGGSLAERIEQHGALPCDEALEVIAAIADALASAHRRGVLHRDVTPANVLFTSDGHPLLTDFGVAITDPTASTPPAGTPGYLDPALLAGHPPSPASDVYALAAMTYHALAGRLPVDGDGDEALLTAAREGRLVPLAVAAPTVPVAVAELVDRSLSPDPASRPSDAGVFLDDLRRARAHAGASPAVVAAGTAASPPALPGGPRHDPAPARGTATAPPPPPPATATAARRAGTVDFGVRPPSGTRPSRTPDASEDASRWVLLLAVALLSVLAVEIALVPSARLGPLLLLQSPPAVAAAAVALWWTRTP